MTTWSRRSHSSHLDNLARKARRRGDAAEAVTWYRALSLRQSAEERAHLAAERRWRFNNDRRKLKGMEEELDRLRRYAAWHPRAAAEAPASSPADAALAPGMLSGPEPASIDSPDSEASSPMNQHGGGS